MMSDLNRLWRVLVSIAIVGLYVGGYMISAENDRIMCNHRKSLVTLKKNFTGMAELINAKKKGKRNTYCDQLRHLVVDHGYPVYLLDECKDAPITDLQKTLGGIK